VINTCDAAPATNVNVDVAQTMVPFFHRRDETNWRSVLTRFSLAPSPRRVRNLDTALGAHFMPQEVSTSSADRTLDSSYFEFIVTVHHRDVHYSTTLHPSMQLQSRDSVPKMYIFLSVRLRMTQHSRSTELKCTNRTYGSSVATTPRSTDSWWRQSRRHLDHPRTSG